MAYKMKLCSAIILLIDSVVVINACYLLNALISKLTPAYYVIISANAA